MTTSPGHALIVGGSGMLRGASLGLVERGYAVSVVARNARRLEELKDQAACLSGVLRPVCVDYRRRDAFAFGLSEAVRALGPPSLAVVWTHTSAPDAPLDVAEILQASGVRADFFHLLGSAAADPSQPDPGRRAPFAAFTNVAYHEVVLGFVTTANRSRWLNDSEISRGVLHAIDQRDPRTIVGVVEPWSARPWQPVGVFVRAGRRTGDRG